MSLPNEKHWVFKKHTNNIDLLVEVALYLKENKSGISGSERRELFKSLRKNSTYRPRQSAKEMKLDAVNHRIDELSYYLFGYSGMLDGKKKFIFSPLGNMFLKHLDDREITAKIFATMLFGIQFPHPASEPSLEFKLHPFRLIFALLLDERLESKLYDYEVYKYIINVSNLTQESYEVLVQNIIQSRNSSTEEKFATLKAEEHEIVKSVYEWEYYVRKLLQSQGIIEVQIGNENIKLFHPSKKNSTSAPTSRKATNGSFILTPEIKKFIVKLFKQYSLFDEVLELSDDKRQSSEVVKEIYSFYPELLLEEIGEKVHTLSNELVKLPKLIEEYSLNKDGETFGKFEDTLEMAFNQFYNVEAEKLAGAGRTDIECIYLPEPEKFAVEAKSTANKLSGINAGRLAHHRELIGARYTIVVTPRYVPSVKYDIVGQNIVIIKANTLAEYLYNYINSDIDKMDYQEIREIILNNLGTDISLKVSEKTLSRFG